MSSSCRRSPVFSSCACWSELTRIMLTLFRGALLVVSFFAVMPKTYQIAPALAPSLETHTIQRTATLELTTHCNIYRYAVEVSRHAARRAACHCHIARLYLLK